MVKWSWGDNRRLRDTDWLGYTSILSFFLSLPSFLLLFDVKLNSIQFQNSFFTFFCISNTKHTHVDWDTNHRTLVACVVNVWGFG